MLVIHALQGIDQAAVCRIEPKLAHLGDLAIAELVADIFQPDFRPASMMLITICVFSAFFLAALQPKSRKPQACALAVVISMVARAAEAARSSLFMDGTFGKFCVLS